MTPTDLREVQAAIRLGWLMAEVRGRARPDSPAWGEERPMARGGWALPLAAERSPVELGIERANALASVAIEQVHVDAVINADVLKDISSVPGLPPDLLDAGPDGRQTYALLMRVIVTKVLRGRPGPNAKESKDFEKLVGALGEVLYHWDAVIQDSLISRSDGLANGYELGRAVAETYWSLDPKAPALVEEAGTLLPNPGSWEFLFGEERRRMISQLLQRLAPYFAPLVAPSVAASVEVWGTVAAPQAPKRHIWGTKRQKRETRPNTWCRAADAQSTLRRQVANWYSLLVAGLDPETLLKPYAVLRSWRSAGKALRVLFAEAVVAVIGVALIAAFGVLMADASKNLRLEAALAALGVVGITGAGVQARIKAKTQSALARLAQDLSTDLIASQITVTPTRPSGTSRLWADNETREAIASRTVTATLPRAG